MYVALALDWVVAAFDPVVLVVRRHPLDVVASRLALGSLLRGGDQIAHAARVARAERWGVDPDVPREPVKRDAWITGFTMSLYEEARAAHPEFHVVEHEQLCRDPVGEFALLAGRLGLHWGERARAVIDASNRPGAGWETNRITAEQPGKWRTCLTRQEVRVAVDVLRRFPVAAGYDELAW